jgi:SAM-dependent methyltransferase
MDWFENESFWRTFYPFMFSPERIAAATGEVDAILALVGRDAETVLDLCCGPGRHSLEFAARGQKVTGVDRSAFLLGKARERAVAAQLTVEWIEDDMRHFRRPASFDLALSWFTSFGYFEQDAENRAALGNIHASLAPGGVLAMDVLGKEVLARRLENSRVTEVGAATMVQSHQVFDDWSKIRNRWIWIEDARTRTFEIEHWVYSGVELKDRLLDAGFSTVQLYGDTTGSPYGPEAQRLIAVAKK